MRSSVLVHIKAYFIPGIENPTVRFGADTMNKNLTVRFGEENFLRCGSVRYSKILKAMVRLGVFMYPTLRFVAVLSNQDPNRAFWCCKKYDDTVPSDFF